MKIIKRALSSYPRPPCSGKLIDLTKFPFKFQLEKPESMTIEDNESNSIQATLKKKIGDIEGAKFAFETLLTSFATGNFKDLEDLTEFNFLQTLKKSYEECKNDGIQINLSGSCKDAIVTVSKDEIHTGQVLPYRNLNNCHDYPIKKTNFRNMHTYSKHISFIELIKSAPDLKSLTDFDDLDFRKINELDDISDYKERLKILYD